MNGVTQGEGIPTSNIPDTRSAKDADELARRASVVRDRNHVCQRACIIINDSVEDIDETVGRTTA